MLRGAQEKMKMVNVTILKNKSIRLPFIIALVDRVCQLLAEVRITPVCEVSRYKPVLDEDRDALLERFTRVRVGSVHFTMYWEGNDHYISTF